MASGEVARHYRTDVKVGETVLVWTDEGKIGAKLVELGYEWATVQFFPPRRKQRIYFTRIDVNDRGDTVAKRVGREIDMDGLASVPASDLRPIE